MINSLTATISSSIIKLQNVASEGNMKRDKLLKLRKEKKLTQEQLANLAGIKRNYYGLIENGTRNPSLDIAIKIAIALNESLECVFEDDFDKQQ